METSIKHALIGALLKRDRLGQPSPERFRSVAFDIRPKPQHLEDFNRLSSAAVDLSKLQSVHLTIYGGEICRICLRGNAYLHFSQDFDELRPIPILAKQLAQVITFDPIMREPEELMECNERKLRDVYRALMVLSHTLDLRVPQHDFRYAFARMTGEQRFRLREIADRAIC